MVVCKIHGGSFIPSLCTPSTKLNCVCDKSNPKRNPWLSHRKPQAQLCARATNKTQGGQTTQPCV